MKYMEFKLQECQYIKKAVDASPELRSKKALIETFIAGINDVEDVMTEWHDFVVKQREEDLKQIIAEEKLKEEETRKFLDKSFNEGNIKTVGTDIDKIMPPVSRFGGGRAKKKQGVIDKLKAFFDKYFGIGGSAKFTEPRITSPIGVQQDIHLNEDGTFIPFTYDRVPASGTVLKAAEPVVPYGIKRENE